MKPARNRADTDMLAPSNRIITVMVRDLTEQNYFAPGARQMMTLIGGTDFRQVEPEAGKPIESIITVRVF